MREAHGVNRHLRHDPARTCERAREADIIGGPLSPCWLPSLTHTSGPASFKHSPRRLIRAALGLIASAPIYLVAPAALAAPAAAPPGTAAQATTPPTPAPQIAGPIPAPKPKPKKKPEQKINWLNPTTWPVLPVPLTAVDPNSGLTLGMIPTMLVTNASNEITDIIAPDILHNPYFGWGADGRILAFPSEDTQWSIVGGAEQRVESMLDLQYETGLLRESPFSLTVQGLYDRSGTPRFFGIGNNSFQINQTVYIDQQIGAYSTLGWNINHKPGSSPTPSPPRRSKCSARPCRACRRSLPGSEERWASARRTSC